MEGPPLKRQVFTPLTFWMIIILLALIIPNLSALFKPPEQVLAYSAFKTALSAGQISSVLVSDTAISGKMQDSTAFSTVRVTDPDLTKILEAQNVEIRGQAPSSNGGFLGILLTWVLPLALMASLWFSSCVVTRGTEDREASTTSSPLGRARRG
ncbi:MAG: ATP-dependent metallopeptidase FtsH/Yme1/Tma family protein [Anaerolineales bacterium]|nr:ATP-dependent metallopeptidase FtsH/Yme1/Tma family protein [Anaerolineales bacterium]